MTLSRMLLLSLPFNHHPRPLPDSVKVPEVLTLPFSVCLFFPVIIGLPALTGVVLSDGSVLVMGGGFDNRGFVWKTVDGGASWILVTSSAAWGGKKILHLGHPLHILPFVVEDACIRHRYSVSRVSSPDVRNSQCHDYLGSYISDYDNEGFHKMTLSLFCCFSLSPYTPLSSASG